MDALPLEDRRRVRPLVLECLDSHQSRPILADLIDPVDAELAAVLRDGGRFEDAVEALYYGAPGDRALLPSVRGMVRRFAVMIAYDRKRSASLIPFQLTPEETWVALPREQCSRHCCDCGIPRRTVLALVRRLCHASHVRRLIWWRGLEGLPVTEDVHQRLHALRSIISGKLKRGA